MANAKHRCRNCKTYFPWLPEYPSFRVWCGDECALSLSLKRLPRIQKAQEKERKKVIREKKSKHYENELPRQKELTQIEANKLCKLLDKDKPCIACGRPYAPGKGWHAMHFKSRGANSFLRYSLINLHAGCWKCNHFESGNLPGYRQGLTERHGSSMADYLDSSPRVKDWTCPELIQLRKLYASESRRLIRGETASRDWRGVQTETAHGIQGK